MSIRNRWIIRKCKSRCSASIEFLFYNFEVIFIMKKIIGIILIVVGIISTSIGGVTLFNVKSNVASRRI